jgi:deoxyribodipyrimidine photolyase-related protein
MPAKGRPTLVLILGDQLSPGLSSLAGADPASTVILMTEVWDETTYVRHHKKKIAFILSAMRHFAAELTAAGWRVDYVRLDDADNTGSFSGEVARAVKRHKAQRVIVTEPGEWRVAQMIKGWSTDLGVHVEVRTDLRFIYSRAAFAEWAQGRKMMRMEHFYHEARRATGLLMESGQPVGGQWNFDAENRVTPDAITRDVLALVAQRFGNHIGSLDPFWYAVTRQDALRALDHFIKVALPNFGDFQDAMVTGQKFLYHAVLSQYLNAGLLDPREICAAAESAYTRGAAPLNAVEGFIRQIIGWREYVRGIYWLKMPDYASANYFGNTRALPDFYWTGQTRMACLKAAIDQTIEEAYAHHIQRLMVTGNFAMLAGVNPHEVHEWYLAVYADAYEWVELPNVIGMSQFADGGVLGSKPYAAGGNYINKMSNYCSGCSFDVKQRVGPKACPFNALYWHFLHRNRDKLFGLQRLRTVYSTWDKMSEADRTKTLASADAFLADLA